MLYKLTGIYDAEGKTKFSSLWKYEATDCLPRGIEMGKVMFLETVGGTIETAKIVSIGKTRNGHKMKITDVNGVVIFMETPMELRNAFHVTKSNTKTAAKGGVA